MTFKERLGWHRFSARWDEQSHRLRRRKLHIRWRIGGNPFMRERFDAKCEFMVFRDHYKTRPAQKRFHLSRCRWK